MSDYIVRYTACSEDENLFWGFETSCPVQIRLFVPLATAGDHLRPGPDGRSGLFFFQASSLQEQNRLYDALLSGNLLRYS